MEHEANGPQNQTKEDKQRRSAQSYLKECATFFLEAKIEQRTIDKKPNLPILFAAIRLRFLRYTTCEPLNTGILKPNLNSQKVLKIIEQVRSLIHRSQEKVEDDKHLAEMQIPAAYDQTPEPRRERLHNVLIDMGNTHRSPASFTDPIPDRQKPVIKDTTRLEPLLPQMKSLEDSLDQDDRSKLQRHCAEELKRVKDKGDFPLLAGIATDDEVLGKEIQKMQNETGHVYENNTGEKTAKVLFGDSYSGGTPFLQRGPNHYYRGNRATDNAQVQFGNAYGQPFFT